MRIIAEQLARPSKDGGKIVVSNDDRDFVASMHDLATGDVIEDGGMDATFCCNVLAMFGLLNKGENGGFKPTPSMMALLLERCSSAQLPAVSTVEPGPCRSPRISSKSRRCSAARW
jgi:hypothetical protein